jgi:preprotein translocase subunit SecG
VIRVKFYQNKEQKVKMTHSKSYVIFSPMNTILLVVQIALSLILVILILLQSNESSLGGAFGGDDSGGVAHTRRGIEKTIFQATIVFGIIFVVVSFVVFAIS